MKRIMLVMLAALFLLVSCGKKEEAAAGGEEKKGGKKKFAIMVPNTTPGVHFLFHNGNRTKISLIRN